VTSVPILSLLCLLAATLLPEFPQSAIRNPQLIRPHRGQEIPSLFENRPHRGNALSPNPCHLTPMKVELSVPGNEDRMRATDCLGAVLLSEPSLFMILPSMILSSLPLPRISSIPWLSTALYSTRFPAHPVLARILRMVTSSSASDPVILGSSLRNPATIRPITGRPKTWKLPNEPKSLSQSATEYPHPCDQIRPNQTTFFAMNLELTHRQKNHPFVFPRRFANLTP